MSILKRGQKCKLTKVLKKTIDGRIASVVRKKAAAGVPVKEILSSIQNYQNAPGSLQTFYKYYGSVMEEARGEVTEALGSKVIQQAKNGDFKSQELWLTTKGGWSKQQTNNNIEISDDPEKGKSALDNLLMKLGIEEKEEE